MASILDVATQLMPTGTYSTNQSFTPIAAHPRTLPTTMLTIQMLTPPAAAASFAVEIASTANGVYSPISTYLWPAGVSGSKQVAFGVNTALAQVLNNTSVWVRLSLTTSGALTGSAWLTKPSDGGPGLGSRSYSLDGINAF